MNELRTMAMRMTRPTRRGPLSVLLALVAALIVLAGCGSSAPAPSGSVSPSPATGGPITVTDDAGLEVTLKQPAERVVSLAPSNTETAFAIGAGGKLVAGTSYDDYPAAAKKLPKIGDFSKPSVEKIISFKPDLVLSSGGIQKDLRDKLTKLGVAVYEVDPTTYQGVIDDLSELGRLLDTDAEAAKVVATMEKARGDVQAKVTGRERPLTFIEIYSKPLMTAGKGTFMDDLVTLAGGKNLGAEAGEGFPNYSTEVLLKKDPAVYVAMAGSMSQSGDIAKRSAFVKLSAIKNKRVYVIEDGIAARPGPRLADGLQRLAEMIHPEAFPVK